MCYIINSNLYRYEKRNILYLIFGCVLSSIIGCTHQEESVNFPERLLNFQTHKEAAKMHSGYLDYVLANLNEKDISEYNPTRNTDNNLLLNKLNILGEKYIDIYFDNTKERELTRKNFALIVVDNPDY